MNLEEKRIRTYRYLYNQARILLEKHISPDHFKSEDTYEKVSNALDIGIVAFNRAMREAVSDVRDGVDTSQIWAIIDATSFWEDTTPGRWPHMTEVRAQVLLHWAGSYEAGKPFMQN